MQIENGRFYFISNEFIKKYGIKYNLMENKETGNKRPCYFCFKDRQNQHVIWFVPISKQYEKYRFIYEKKKQKIGREPLNFVFGHVLLIKWAILRKCKKFYSIKMKEKENIRNKI